MRIFLLAFLALALGLVRPATADVYNVTIDTSSISGNSGFLDFQFNPGNTPPPLGTVTISNFSGGQIGSGELRMGDVSAGTLPSSISINNTSSYNDYYTPFTYGSSLSFKLSFSGSALTSPNVSSFAFSLLDNANPQAGLLTSNPDSTAFWIDVGKVNVGDNKTSLTNFGMLPGAGSVVMAAVPEPEEYAMMLMGAGMVAFQVKRKQKRSANS
jgi:hypothetical protein